MVTRKLRRSCGHLRLPRKLLGLLAVLGCLCLLRPALGQTGSPDFTLTITPNPANIGVGLTAAFVITATPVNGFTGEVALACPTNLPTESKCQLSAPSIPAGGTATLYLGTTAPHDCGSSSPYFFGPAPQTALGSPSSARAAKAGAQPSAAQTSAPGPYWSIACAAFVVVLVPRRRAMKALLSIALCALLGGALASTTGCGHCTDLGTLPGTYTLPITGTSAGTSATSHTVDIKLTVQL